MALPDTDPGTAVRSGDRLSVKEKVGYAAGDVASNLYFQTFLYFILIYYTDVVGLPAGAVATMFAVSRLWDAVNDPLMAAVNAYTIKNLASGAAATTAIVTGAVGP